MRGCSVNELGLKAFVSRLAQHLKCDRGLGHRLLGALVGAACLSVLLSLLGASA